VEWYLYGPLPNLCPLIPTSNHDGRQAKNRKKGGIKISSSMLHKQNIKRRLFNNLLCIIIPNYWV
jgi:hypothetical protein